MSKIKKVLTEDRSQAKYFTGAVDKALDGILEVWDEIDGQTKYHTNAQFRKKLEATAKQIRYLGSSFEELIRIIAEEK